MDKLRKAFTGQSWPRTKYVSRNLNPRWSGNQVSLLAKNAIGSDALLFIAVVDYDTVGSDEFMCATAMNVKALVSGRLEEENITTKSFDRPLFVEGKMAGRIRFDVDLSLLSRASVAPIHSRAGSVAAGLA
jgi:Ca2+-dependent lipid-binding protein